MKAKSQEWLLDMEMKMKMKAQRVVLDQIVSMPELVQHRVLTHVPPHPEMGDLIATRVPDARFEPFLHF